MSKFESVTVIPAFNEERLIPRCLLSLNLESGTRNDHAVVVVDNGSTDDTQGVVEAYSQFTADNNRVKIFLVTEPEKGTGAACDTGFRFAIDELGANYIYRTDADCEVMPDWLAEGRRRLDKKSRTQLVTGPSATNLTETGLLKDVILSVARPIDRYFKAFQFRSPGMYWYAVGHNMVTSAEAYDKVGGFPRSAIEEVSEDLVYSKKIIKEFGQRALAFERGMFVFTSARRINAMGTLGLGLYNLSDKTRRRLNLDSADFR